MVTVIIFLIVLAILIFVHELGHFFFAKLFGVRVDEFAIGFPPNVYSWTKGETKYSINLIPFGGYCSIHGENPDDKTVNGEDAKRSLIAQVRWKQAVIMFGGILFNLLFAWLVLWGILWFGTNSMPVDGGYPTTDNRIEIVMMAEDSPAALVGLQAGDRLVAFNNSEISTVNDEGIKKIQDGIAESVGEVHLVVARDGEELEFNITPTSTETTDRQIIGIYMMVVGDFDGSFWTTPWYAVKYLYTLSSRMIVGLGDLLYRAFNDQASMDEISGPVGIAKIIGQAYEQSFQSLLLMMVLISVNLAILNLIPFPALDGGRILFIAIEKVVELFVDKKKRPYHLPMAFQNWTNLIGFTILIGFMIFVTYHDVVKLF